jgi:sodium/bile acid cotransporter 7
MKDLFLRRWFLALLLAGLGLALVVPDWLRPWIERLEVRAVVAVALFLMAWSLDSRSLFSSFLRPLPVFWAVMISYGLVPALGWSAGWLLASPDLRIGLLIIASVPCTLASAVLWTRLAGGKEATALLVILVTTATSWLGTTAWLTLGSGTEVTLSVTSLMQDLALVLVLPVALGQICRAVRPMAQAATRHRRLLDGISRLFILAIILKAAVAVRDKLAENSASLTVASLLLTLVLCLGIHLAALSGGFWSSRLLGCDRPTRIAIAFAGSQKTLPVGLYLFDVYFVNTFPLAVIPIAFYHIGQLVVDTLIAEKLAETPAGHRGTPQTSALPE